MNIWAIVPLVSFLIYAALVVVVLQQARKRVNQVFALLLFASGIWSFTSFMLHFNGYPQQTMLWNELLVVALLWSSVCYYHFVRAYNNKPGGIALYLGYASVVALLVLSLSGQIVRSSYVVDGVLHHDLGFSLYILGGISFIFLMSAMLMLVQRYRRSTDPADRNRTMYLITGSGIAIAVSYLCNLTPAIAGLSLDHLGVLANALITAYAIQRYQLLNIRLVARRGLSYLLVIACLIGICGVAVFIGQNFLSDQPRVLPIMLASALVLLVVIMARPLRHIIQELIDRIFYRETYKYRKALLTFSKKMGNIINLDELAREMLPAVTKALNISHAKLLFEDVNSGDFTTQFIYPEGEEDANSGLRFNVDNPIIAWLEKEAGVLIERA